jgi:hypothetical protein
MTKRRGLIVGVLGVVLTCLTAWAFGFFERTDPAIAELKEIGSQMRDSNLADAQRKQLRDDFRERMRSMTNEQRRAFFDANRDDWTGRSQQRMDEFFKMSKIDQQKRLDEILDRMVKSRSSGQNQGRTSNRNRNMTDAQRDARAKQRLDRTSPKMRAQFTEFRKMLDARAAQRGISVGGQGFWGFGGGRRGA